MLGVKPAGFLEKARAQSHGIWPKDGTRAVSVVVLLVFNAFNQHCEVPGQVTKDNNQRN